MRQAAIRAGLDSRSETLNRKIRDSIKEKIPYLCIVGGREAKERSITVRNRDTKKQQMLPYEDFIYNLKAENESRSLVLSCV